MGSENRSHGSQKYLFKKIVYQNKTFVVILGEVTFDDFILWNLICLLDKNN